MGTAVGGTVGVEGGAGAEVVVASRIADTVDAGGSAETEVPGTSGVGLRVGAKVSAGAHAVNSATINRTRRDERLHFREWYRWSSSAITPFT